MRNKFPSCSSLLDRISLTNILPFFHSDHCYVYMEFSLPNQVDLGPSYWKFNTTHLKNPAFQTMIETFWKCWQHQKHRFSSLAAWCDIGKVEQRKRIQTFSCNEACVVKRQRSPSKLPSIT